MAIDDETRNISKTEGGSGILVNSSEETHTVVTASVRRVVLATVGDTTEVPTVETTTSSGDAAEGIIRIFIKAPLPNIATHIIQPIAI